jgi:diketogulonate reductase-like aldo/keto reductase
MLQESLNKAEEVAQEIIGKWEYEEAYWSFPIAEALKTAFEQGYIQGYTDNDTGLSYESPSIRYPDPDVS